MVPSHFMTYLCAAGMASPAYCKYFYALTKYFDVAYLVTGALSAMRSFTARSSRWTASLCAGSAGSRSAGARVMKYLPCVTAGRGQELRRVQQARGGGLHGLQRQVRLSITVGQSDSSKKSLCKRKRTAVRSDLSGRGRDSRFTPIHHFLNRRCGFLADWGAGE